MIKGQCSNCRKYGTRACGQVLIFDGYPCQQYDNGGGGYNPYPGGNNGSNGYPYPGGNTGSNGYPYPGGNIAPNGNPYPSGNPYPTPNTSQNDSFWNNIFSFNGRNRRSYFWYTEILITVIYFVVLFIMGGLLGGDAIPGIASILSIPMLWVSFANITKRCHDLGKSATWILCLFIPLVNLIFILYLAFAPGDKFDNMYGRSPY